MWTRTMYFVYLIEQKLCGFCFSSYICTELTTRKRDDPYPNISSVLFISPPTYRFLCRSPCYSCWCYITVPLVHQQQHYQLYYRYDNSYACLLVTHKQRQQTSWCTNNRAKKQPQQQFYLCSALISANISVRRISYTLSS